MSLRPDDAQARRRPPGGTDRLASVLWAGLRFTEQAQVTGVKNGEAPSPSLTNPPPEPPPSQTRKRKAQSPDHEETLPCPPELRYAEGEILNVDKHARRMGSSSTFRSTPLPIIPLDGKVLSTEADLASFIGAPGVQTSVATVLLELYRKVGPTTGEEALPTPREGEAFSESDDGNRYKTQYYTQTLKMETTMVVHIVQGGEFWDEAERDGPRKLRTRHKGESVYTTGMLWCNTSPNWEWKTRDDTDTVIRCRIHLPAGTQVIVDRSPVRGLVNSCEFGDHEKKKSPFPDVLLLPGEFEIEDVKRYKDVKHPEEYESDDKDDDDLAQKDEIQPTPDLKSGHRYPPGTVMSDEVYASRRLRNEDVNNFLDVRLRVKRMMRVPDERVADFAFKY